ncbi:Uncharacterised protein [Vibrio cholerae]|nr:Uncharacterised protein [Vibrio cholerae]
MVSGTVSLPATLAARPSCSNKNSTFLGFSGRLACNALICC